MVSSCSFSTTLLLTRIGIWTLLSSSRLVIVNAFTISSPSLSGSPCRGSSKDSFQLHWLASHPPDAAPQTSDDEVQTAESRKDALASTANTTLSDERPPCFYRAPPNNQWRPRWELSELTVGQELQAVVVQELLNGTTGPKVFCEVGVGKWRRQTKGRASPVTDQSTQKTKKSSWKIVHAMLRLGPPRGKQSVALKRAARLRKKQSLGFPVFVQKIRLESDQLEVCLDRDEALDVLKQQQQSDRVSVSSLTVGQELMGQVIRVEPYGVLLDVGANRHGLLHIRTVAQLFQRYIAGRDGLQQTAGLSRGSRVNVQVQSIEKKRLQLDFTNQAKETVQEIIKEEQQEAKQRKKPQNRKQKEPVLSSDTETSISDAPQKTTSMSSSSSSAAVLSLSAEEEAAWAAFGASASSAPSTSSSESDATTYNHEDYEDEVYDEYDEDRDIEDALGLGTY